MKRIRASAIVPAAGSGSRIRETLRGVPPKPYLELGGIPILARTLAGLEAVPEVGEVVVACQPRFRKVVLGYAKRYGLSKLKTIVAGGRTRTESVYKALQRTDPRHSHVLIHDSVRPFLPPSVMSRMIKTASSRGWNACVIGRPATSTIKEVRDGKVVRTADRKLLWEIGTPQLFRRSSLVSAYRNHTRKPFEATDDSSLAEAAGETVMVFSCDEPNMKITTPHDLRLARKMTESNDVRVGMGEDLHRLVPDRPLMLGGIRVPSQRGSSGHSDGDVILHSITDALLGAVGAGDIGEYFPDHDPKWKGQKSALFIREALRIVRERGFGLLNADVTVTIEWPKLGLLKKTIQKNVSKLLGIPVSSVGIKAKTSEGLGSEGRGEALSARAIVLLERIPS